MRNTEDRTKTKQIFVCKNVLRCKLFTESLTYNDKNVGRIGTALQLFRLDD